MSTLLNNISKRVNGGGPSLTERFLSLLETVEPTQTITTTSSSTGAITTTNTNTIFTTSNGTTSSGTLYNQQDWTVTRYPTPTYNPYGFSTSESVGHYNIENINIDVLRKFMVKEISFVNDLIEIDNSELNYATLVLSVDYDVYKELKVEYILEKVEDYVKENISGLIHCMDPDLDIDKLHMIFVPKSTLLDIIKNDKED